VTAQRPPRRQGRPRGRAARTCVGVAIVRTGGGNEQDRVRISVHRVSQMNCIIDLALLQK